jgi:hypothetical protein
VSVCLWNKNGNFISHVVVVFVAIVITNEIKNCTMMIKNRDGEWQARKEENIETLQ